MAKGLRIFRSGDTSLFFSRAAYDCTRDERTVRRDCQFIRQLHGARDTRRARFPMLHPFAPHSSFSFRVKHVLNIPYANRATPKIDSSVVMIHGKNGI